MKDAALFLCFSFLFFATSCGPVIPPFSTENLDTNGLTLQPYFPEGHLNLLKEEWVVLYDYLKMGHLQMEEKSGKVVVYSFDFYKYITAHRSKIFDTPFLQPFDQFITVFGPPADIFEQAGKMILLYTPIVYGESCASCQSVKKLQFAFDQSGELIAD